MFKFHISFHNNLYFTSDSVYSNFVMFLPITLFSGAGGTITPFETCFSANFECSPKKSLNLRNTLNSALRKAGTEV